MTHGLNCCWRYHDLLPGIVALQGIQSLGLWALLRVLTDVDQANVQRLKPGRCSNGVILNAHSV
jgi:hypothetical protein